MLGSVVDVLLVVVPGLFILAILFLVFATLRKGEAGGFGYFERKRMRREGQRARAAIIDLVIPPKSFGDVAHQAYQLVVEVCHDNGQSWRAPLKLSWNWEKWSHLATGMDLPVLVSQSFPGRVMVDYESLRRERGQAATSRVAADAARQRALINGGR